jgi:hypothetical protein
MKILDGKELRCRLYVQQRTGKTADKYKDSTQTQCVPRRSLHRSPRLSLRLSL